MNKMDSGYVFFLLSRRHEYIYNSEITRDVTFVFKFNNGVTAFQL